MCLCEVHEKSGRGGVQLREARYGLFNMERGLRGEGTKEWISDRGGRAGGEKRGVRRILMELVSAAAQLSVTGTQGGSDRGGSGVIESCPFSSVSRAFLCPMPEGIIMGCIEI